MFLLWTMFLAGLLHGLGPDHLAAIAALAGRDRQREIDRGTTVPPGGPNRPVVLLGIRFALGHVSTLLLLAGLAGWLGGGLPGAWQVRLEQWGGVVLVFLGGWLLAAIYRDRVILHEHTHEHGDREHTHSHLHMHLKGARSAHRHPHPAWFIGGLLGFSGARALLTALPLVLAGSLPVMAGRALAFGAGIVISMTAAGWIAARLIWIVSTPGYARALVALTGGLSAAVGLYWLAAPPGI